MKVFPKGWITWTAAQNYIEVELNPSELPKYEPGQPFENDNQWAFGATESDLAFTLTNRGKPSGFLIWVNAGAGRGNHVSVYDDAESIAKMSTGGSWRNDALWIPQSTNENNFYKLENLANRGSFLTWTYKKHNDFNYYIQMASYDANEDSKFSFTPLGMKLEARVYDFVYAESPDDILKREQNLNRVLVAKKHFPNLSDVGVTAIVEESGQTTDSFTIEFKESLAMMNRTTIGTRIHGISFEGGLKANEQKAVEFISSFPLKTEIKIPPYSDVEASIYTISANNVELSFTAKMDIIGFAERMVVDRPGEVKYGSVTADLVEDFIKSSTRNKMEVISRSGDNLTVRVSGVMKGSMGLKTVINTTESKIFELLPENVRSIRN